MKDHDDVTEVTRKLLTPGFIFESSESGLIPMRIHRNIDKDKAVDILPTLKAIYSLTREGKTEKAAELISELTGLLVAADLGIAKEFLIEMQVKKGIGRLNRQVDHFLKKSAKNSVGRDQKTSGGRDLRESESSINDSHKG